MKEDLTAHKLFEEIKDISSYNKNQNINSLSHILPLDRTHFYLSISGSDRTPSNEFSQRDIYYQNEK